MTTIDDIVAAIVAALAADLGTYDLSATDQVKEGAFVAPPGSVAFAAVLPPEQTAGEEQARGLIVVETHTTEIRVWAPFTSEDTTARAQAVRALAAEVKDALDAARLGTDSESTALGRCVSCAVTRVRPDPAGAQAGPSWVHCALFLTTTHRRGR